MYRMMIVEDDAQIARGIKQTLEKWGYEALCVEDFAAVDDMVRKMNPSLVLMDISLPFYNGYYWCEKIRRHSKVPIVFVSSRSDSMDIVMAVNMGGDDYIVKPFVPEVLLAKVQALLRRAYDYEAGMSTLGNVIYDQKAGCLKGERGEITLTRNENRILSVLFANRGKIISREKIMLALWDSDEFVDDNTLTVNMNRLRKTLEMVGVFDVIITHKGQGYRLNA